MNEYRDQLEDDSETDVDVPIDTSVHKDSQGTFVTGMNMNKTSGSTKQTVFSKGSS